MLTKNKMINLIFLTKKNLFFMSMSGTKIVHTVFNNGNKIQISFIENIQNKCLKF